MATNDVFEKNFREENPRPLYKVTKLRSSAHRIILILNRPNQPIQSCKEIANSSHHILSRRLIIHRPSSQKTSTIHSRIRCSGIQRRSLISETTMDRPLPGTQSAVHNLRMPRRRRISH